MRRTFLTAFLTASVVVGCWPSPLRPLPLRIADRIEQQAPANVIHIVLDKENSLSVYVIPAELDETSFPEWQEYIVVREAYSQGRATAEQYLEAWEKFRKARSEARRNQVKQILEAVWSESFRIEPTNVFTYFLVTQTVYTLEHGPGTVAQIVFVVKVSGKFVQEYLKQPSEDWELFSKRINPFVSITMLPTYFTEKPNHLKKGVLR